MIWVGSTNPVFVIRMPPKKAAKKDAKKEDAENAAKTQQISWSGSLDTALAYLMKDNWTAFKTCRSKIEYCRRWGTKLGITNLDPGGDKTKAHVQHICSLYTKARDLMNSTGAGTIIKEYRIGNKPIREEVTLQQQVLKLCPVYDILDSFMGTRANVVMGAGVGLGMTGLKGQLSLTNGGNSGEGTEDGEDENVLEGGGVASEVQTTDMEGWIPHALNNSIAPLPEVPPAFTADDASAKDAGEFTQFLVNNLSPERREFYGYDSSPKTPKTPVDPQLSSYSTNSSSVTLASTSQSPSAQQTYPLTPHRGEGLAPQWATNNVNYSESKQEESVSDQVGGSTSGSAPQSQSQSQGKGSSKRVVGSKRTVATGSRARSSVGGFTRKRKAPGSGFADASDEEEVKDVPFEAAPREIKPTPGTAGRIVPMTRSKTGGAQSALGGLESVFNLTADTRAQKLKISEVKWKARIVKLGGGSDEQRKHELELARLRAESEFRMHEIQSSIKITELELKHAEIQLQQQQQLRRRRTHSRSRSRSRSPQYTRKSRDRSRERDRSRSPSKHVRDLYRHDSARSPRYPVPKTAARAPFTQDKAPSKPDIPFTKGSTPVSREDESPSRRSKAPPIGKPPHFRKYYEETQMQLFMGNESPGYPPVSPTQASQQWHDSETPHYPEFSPTQSEEVVPFADSTFSSPTPIIKMERNPARSSNAALAKSFSNDAAHAVCVD